MKLFNLDIFMRRASQHGQRHHRPPFEFTMGDTPDDYEMKLGTWDITISRINGRGQCRCGLKPCLSEETRNKPSSGTPPVLRLV